MPGPSRRQAYVHPEERRWRPTTHAVARYRERVRPDLDELAARWALLAVAREAVCLGTQADGSSLWHVPDRPDEAVYVLRGDVVVTVLDTAIREDIAREALFTPRARDRVRARVRTPPRRRPPHGR